MTPDEAARHEWILQGTITPHNHTTKIIQKEHHNDSTVHKPQSQQSVSYKTQKYFIPPSIVTSRQLHQTQQIILPDVKTPSKHCSNYKLLKDRTKGN